MLDILLTVIALLVGCACAGALLYMLVLKPWWFDINRQRERLGQQLAHTMAVDVLDRSFGYSHVKGDGLDRIRQTVRFLTPLGQRVTFAADEAGNDNPGSFLWYWDWSSFQLRGVPLASVYLELDLNHIPYDHTVDWLVDHKDDIELQCDAVLFCFGARRVKLHHVWLQDRRQRRIIFRVIFREREKGPDIPQHVDFEEMITAWVQYENEQQKYNRLERFQREQFKARLLDYGIKEHHGTFPLKKIQATFASEVSHRQIEAIGQELEAAGILIPTCGPKPRKIDLEQARAFISRG